jgi:hypothetical protein
MNVRKKNPMSKNLSQKTKVKNQSLKPKLQKQSHETNMKERKPMKRQKANV